MRSIQPHEIARLWEQELRTHRAFAAGTRARAALERLCLGALERARHCGDIRVFAPDGEARAVLICGAHDSEVFGSTVDELKVHFAPGDEVARRWVEVQLPSLSWASDRTHTMSLAATHHALLPALLYHGLGIDSVELLGNTQTSLTRLVERYDPPGDFQAAGLRYVPLREDLLEAATALRETVFSRLPEYCWFGASEGHLRSYRTRMATELRGPHLWFALLEADRVVGVFGSSISPHNPLWGPRGGLEFIFDEKFCGRGLVKTAYRIGLEGLIDAGLPVYKGATAQPAVMSLGQLMERELQLVHLRSGAHFGREHFAPLL